MSRSLETLEPIAADAIGRYLASSKEADARRDLGSAIAAVIGVLLGEDDRWPAAYWVDDALPESIDRPTHQRVDIIGLLITADERHQWVEPFRAAVELASSGKDLDTYLITVGDAVAGLSTVAYGGRLRKGWPHVEKPLFTFTRS